jgi:hypothetical protein
MDDNKAIDTAVDGFFGLATSTISFLRPSLGIVAIAMSPVLAEKAKEWLKSWVNQGKITSREYNRLSDGLDGMSETLKLKKISDSIRDDELFLSHADGFCDADDIFEMMLNQIKQDSEKKKAHFSGNFIGNIPFVKDLGYSELMQYSRVIGQISYSEMCLIQIFYSHYKNKSVSFTHAETLVKQNEDPSVDKVLSEVLHLRNLGLLHNVPPYSLGENIGRVMLSFYGKRLYELLRLDLLDNDDVNKSLEVLRKIT